MKLFSFVGFLLVMLYVAVYCSVIGGIVFVIIHFVKKVW